MTAARDQLRQRADYTHKHNLTCGRHGWLRLTPAYSVKVVEDLIRRCDAGVRVLDPFCGTATTALSAAYHGHAAVTTDINPFLVWLGEAKTARYSARAIASTRKALSDALAEIGSVEPFPVPPIHNIERWWSHTALLFLQTLKASIAHVTRDGSAQRTLLLIAFCRTAIVLSNAAFNHQSMSFKDGEQPSFDIETNFSDIFRQDVEFVLSGAADNPSVAATVLLGDSRRLPEAVDGPFEQVITSPPYANRMSYIRELRPYMYWLGYLTNGRDAGELDWRAIGGTWGIATTRLLAWEPTERSFQHRLLVEPLEKIAHRDNKNGPLLAKYVEKYFDDMWSHFQGLRSVLARGAEVHYIVGNSTFYGTMVPTEQIYEVMLKKLGFADVEWRPIRKRNSNKALIEFDVTGRWA